jgi:hypothetical protein
MNGVNEKERVEAIKRYLEVEKQTDICRILGIIKTWFIKWLKRSRSGKEEWFKNLPKRPLVTPKKVDMSFESVIVKIREPLIEGNEYSMKYGYVGAEAIQYQMEKLGILPI